MSIRRDLLCIPAMALATLVAAPAQAQTFAYVVGQRDDPAPGNSGIQVVSVIDAATNTIVASIPVGLGCVCVDPDIVAIAPDGSRAYVTNELANSMSVIDTASNSVVATVAVGTGPAAVAVSPDGTHVYVVNGSGTTSVSVIDAQTNTIIATIPLGVAQARGVAVRPDGARLYVTTYGSNSIKVIDTGSHSVVNTIAVGSLPIGIDITPDGTRAYVANFLANTVSVVDTGTEAVVATVTVGSTPRDVSITPDGLRAYVASTGTSVIDTQTNAVVGSVANTSGASLDITGGAVVYLASFWNVQTIDTATNTVTATIPFDETTQGHPAAVAILEDLGAPVSTTTTLSASSGSVVFGQSVTFTASVSSANGTPTGSVEFFDGGISLGTAALSGGVAVLATAALSVGTHVVSATYSGDTGFLSSDSSNVSVTVATAHTTTTLASSPNPSPRRQLVTVTATVAALPPGGGTPTGQVELFDRRKRIGVSSLVNGVATFQVSFRAAGDHELTANYLGDMSFLGSLSATHIQTITR